MDSDLAANEVTAETAALLRAHGYNPHLPPQRTFSSTPAPREYEGLVLSEASDVVPGLVRPWVCALDGVIVDGHRFSEEYSDTHCLVCGAELEPGKLRVSLWRADPVNKDIRWYTVVPVVRQSGESYHAVVLDGKMSVVKENFYPVDDQDLRRRVAEAIERHRDLILA